MGGTVPPLRESRERKKAFLINEVQRGGGELRGPLPPLTRPDPYERWKSREGTATSVRGNPLTSIATLQGRGIKI